MNALFRYFPDRIAFDGLNAYLMNDSDTNNDIFLFYFSVPKSTYEESSLKKNEVF